MNGEAALAAIIGYPIRVVGKRHRRLARRCPGSFFRFWARVVRRGHARIMACSGLDSGSFASFVVGGTLKRWLALLGGAL